MKPVLALFANEDFTEITWKAVAGVEIPAHVWEEAQKEFDQIVTKKSLEWAIAEEKEERT